MDSYELSKLDIRIFDKWDNKVEIRDPSLKKYISLMPVYLHILEGDMSTGGLEKQGSLLWRD